MKFECTDKFLFQQQISNMNTFSSTENAVTTTEQKQIVSCIQFLHSIKFCVS